MRTYDEGDMMDEKNAGLLHMYDVKRVNDPEGKHDGCRYFVLDPQHDPLAREALDAYSRAALNAGYGDLARDVDWWLTDLAASPRDEPDICGIHKTLICDCTRYGNVEAPMRSSLNE